MARSQKRKEEEATPKEEDMTMGLISSDCSTRYKNAIQNMTAEEAWPEVERTAKENLSALHRKSGMFTNISNGKHQTMSPRCTKI